MSAAVKQQGMVDSGRKSFAFGLHWLTPDEDVSPQKAAGALMREVAGVHDLVLYRKGRPAQFALGSRASGLKPGAFSAAGIVAGTLEGSWLLAMRLPIGYWICAGRDNAVLPSGDALYSDEGEAREAFERMLAQAGWSSIYAPSDWGFHFDEIAFEELVRTSPATWTRLQPASRTGAIIRLGAALALIAVMIYAASGLMAPEPEPEIDQAAVDAILAANQAAAEAERQAILARLDANKPWAALPPSDLLVATCIDAIRDMPLAPLGYAIETVGCIDGVTEASLRRAEGGYATWLEEWASSRPQVSIEIDTNGENAFMRMEIDPLSPGGDFELPDYLDVVRSFHRHAQVDEARLSIEAPQVTLIEEYPDYVPKFGSAPFSIATKRPDLWIDALAGHAGAKVGTVLFNPAEVSYTLEGSLYVRNR